MILKDFRVKTSGVEFVQLLKNSFRSGQVYSCKYIKAELIRLYDLLGIKPKKAITSETIKEFFVVRKTKQNEQRAYMLLEPLI